MELITVGKASHATHDSEDIVVDSEYLYGVSGINILEVKGGIVNARHVACTRWLVLFGLEGERVNVNGLKRVNGDTFVMLVRLHKLEIGRFSRRGAVMSIELNVSFGVSCGVFADALVGFLFNPDEFLNGVVKVKFEFATSFLVTSELKLFNKVFVGDLSESAALISVEVNVIDI